MDEKNDDSGMEREKEMIDLQAVAGENPKRKGEMIEAAFLAKVCKLRIPVCKPVGRQRALRLCGALEQRFLERAGEGRDES